MIVSTVAPQLALGRLCPFYDGFIGGWPFFIHVVEAFSTDRTGRVFGEAGRDSVRLLDSGGILRLVAAVLNGKNALDGGASENWVTDVN